MSDAVVRLQEIARATRAVSSALDAVAVLDVIAKAIASLREHVTCVIRLRDDSAGGWRLAAVSASALLQARPAVIPFGAGLTQAVADGGRPLLVSDAARDPRLFDPPADVDGAAVMAFYGVPIVAADEVLGVFQVLFRGGPDPSPEERAIVDIMAGHSAVAIRHTRLLGESDRRLRDARRLYEESAARQRRLASMVDVARKLTSRLDLASVLAAVAETAAEVFEAEVGFRLLEGEDLVRYGATPGAREAMKRERLRIGESISGQVAATGEPIVSEDTASDPRAIDEHHRAHRTGRTATLLCVPIRGRAGVLGTLNIYRERGRSFDEDDRRLAMSLADQTGVALENARLYEDKAKQLRVAEALLEITRATGSTLELKPLLKIVAQRAAQAVDATRCSINFWQEQHLVPVMSQFADGHHDPDAWAKFKAMGRYALDQVPAHAQAIQSRSAVRIEDAMQSDLIPAYWREAFGIRAALVVPLVCKGEVIGTLNLDQTAGPYAWAQEQVDLAMTIANQVALVIENARLYDELRGQLTQLRETQSQLVQAGKLAAVGQLVAGVAHEVNNPLTVVIGQASLLKLKTGDRNVADRADKIIQAATRAARVVRGLKTFAQPKPSELVAVNLAEVLDRVLALRQETFQVNGIVVVRELPPAVPPVWGDAHQLEQVVLNLLLNAEQALSKGSAAPRITLRLASEDGRVRLSVSDSGPGIPPDILPRIFEPFFTTKPVGQGTGLGLSISYGIVEAHGGRILVESSPGQGATFVVDLPAHRAAPASPPAAATPEPPKCRRRVLVVDDEAEVAHTLSCLFQELGHEVTVAVGGEPAWEQLKSGERYDLVTLDLRMPDLPGPRLWDRLVATRSPHVDRIAFVTGDSVDEQTRRFLRATGRPVVNKPFELSDLAALIAD